MKKYAATIGFLLLPQLAFAQAVAVTPGGAVLFSGPHFFAALLAGFALAVAFQLALTHLSVAAGISAIGPVDTRSKTGASARKEAKEDDGAMATARKITTGYGIWTLVTASIALFFASWLAAELSLSGSARIGAIVGLTIWALFYLAMTTLQVGAVTSLVGSLINTATSGLRSMRQVAASLFASSPEEKAADTAAQVAASVRDEIFGEMDPKDVRNQMQNFIRELKPKPIDPREIREELEKLFSETEIRAMTTHDDRLDRDKLIASFETKYRSPERRRETLDRAKGAVATVQEEAKSEKPIAEKVVDAGLRLAAGYSKEEAERTRREWENYLRSTGKAELNPDNIKREIEILVHDPKKGTALLQSRVNEAFNKSTVVSLLEQREDMSHEEAERAADRAEQIIREFRQRGGAVQERLSRAQESAAARVREYLDSLDQPELRYEGLRDDLLRLFHDPKAGADALIRRFKSMDRETLKAILASRRGTSREDAEHILNQIESTRDHVIGKAEQMEAEVERRTNQLKEEALKQAEETRKVVAAAAWWTFLTAVVSGAAAVAGGLIGVA
ncbi:MAG: hypothetical protein EPO39_09900 [Candidatus Manganitrophaceae bacterium]|nr:MAG: hypothetical protein EPO39_09900 [Candidatus Manganitrophaceae bacterium]